MGEADAAKLGQFMAAHGDVAVPEVRVARMGLYASTLTPEGAVHEMLAAYPLGGLRQ